MKCSELKRELVSTPGKKTLLNNKLLKNLGLNYLKYLDR